MNSLVFVSLFLKFAVAMHILEFLDFQCTPSSKGSAEVSNCRMSEDRKLLSVDVDFLRPLNDWKLKVEIFKHNQGSKYSRIFKFPPIDWCPLNDGKTKFTGFQKILDGIRSSTPALFHKCPFEGVHKFTNMSCSKDVIDILPTGQFRAIFTAQDKEDPKIYALNATFSVRTVKKD